MGMCSWSESEEENLFSLALSNYTSQNAYGTFVTAAVAFEGQERKVRTREGKNVCVLCLKGCDRKKEESGSWLASLPSLPVSITSVVGLCNKADTVEVSFRIVM